MSTYAIGDVQGCFETLQRLLARIEFDRSRDRIWLVGDLVNRGPDSLEVLRWAESMGDSLVAVLGNHDLHLLAAAAGLRPPGRRDTLDAVLAASDRERLLAWLRQRPLLHREGTFIMFHAGLAPGWTASEAEELAREAEAALRGGAFEEIMVTLRDDLPRRWDPALSGARRHAAVIAHLTYARMCTADGALAVGLTGPPSDAPQDHLPWFSMPGRKTTSETVVFGHWAALGLHLEKGVVGLDSGCVWGKELTAYRLEDQRIWQEPRYLQE